ncbi:MAG: phosphatidate cytidylyltransferase [Candidatus Marinimicrobia bacterium]|nr:phosphatidate cytidylyltransferase [Candidatus Neomarinimicrobiota bacterium]
MAPRRRDINLPPVTDGPPHKDTIKSRLLVDLVGIPALLTIIWLGSVYYALFVALFVMLGLREYFRLIAKGGLTARRLPGYLAAALLLAASSQYVGLLPGGGGWAMLGKQFLTIVLLLLVALQTWEVVKPAQSPWQNLSVNLVGVLWVAGSGACFILVRSADYSSLDGQVDLAYRLTLALYLSVWVCDSLAYLFGRAYGRRKLFPAASPNKTVVGSVAGLVGAVILMLGLGYGGWLPQVAISPIDLLVFGLITGGIGQLGDFAESRLKRDYQVKDSGRLLPGHGGALDRFDSLLFVMPAAWLYLTWAVF